MSARWQAVVQAVLIAAITATAVLTALTLVNALFSHAWR
jgi:hypothetical protein